METTTSSYPAFMTVTEVAELLRLDPATIRRYIKIGTLECVILPGPKRQSYRIPRENVEKLIGKKL